MEDRSNRKSVSERIQPEMITWSRMGPCFTRLRDADDHEAQRCDAGAEEPNVKVPRLKSVLPAHVGDWRGGSVGRGCSSIFWVHIKVCSAGSHWPGGLQEVVFDFYYQHFKPCRSWWTPTPTPEPPNDTCALYGILLIIIVRREAVSEGSLDFTIMLSSSRRCRKHVSV